MLKGGHTDFLQAVRTIATTPVLLAVAAGYAAHHYKRISIPILLVVVLAYQVAGTLGEWIMVKDFLSAAQDFRIGLPGMALQIFGGYLFISRLIYK